MIVCVHRRNVSRECHIFPAKLCQVLHWRSSDNQSQRSDAIGQRPKLVHHHHRAGARGEWGAKQQLGTCQ